VHKSYGDNISKLDTMVIIGKKT